MTKSQFQKTLRGMLANVRKEFVDVPMERVSNWMGTQLPNPMIYGATSERVMEANLANFGKGERKTTFMSDLSVGEWFGIDGLLDTVKNAMSSWKDDETYMAEFVLCVNWKAWEHHARENTQWSKLYSLLYEGVRDLVYEYYEGDDKKVSYVWSYLD